MNEPKVKRENKDGGKVETYRLRGSWTKEKFERLKTEAGKEKGATIMVFDDRSTTRFIRIFHISELSWNEKE